MGLAVLAFVSELVLSTHQRNVDSRRANAEAAEKVATEVGTLMNQRLQRMARYHEVLSNQSSDTTTFRITYQQTSDLWFEQWPGLVAQTCVYFGTDEAKRLRGINRQFSLLRRMGYAKAPVVHSPARDLSLLNLRDSIEIFQLGLADRLRSPDGMDSDSRPATCTDLVRQQRVADSLLLDSLRRDSVAKSAGPGSPATTRRVPVTK